MCLFLENWEEQRDDLRTYGSTQARYRKWKEKTLAYYAASPVECVEPEDLDPAVQAERRKAYLDSLYGLPDSSE